MPGASAAARSCCSRPACPRASWSTAATRRRPRTTPASRACWTTWWSRSGPATAPSWASCWRATSRPETSSSPAGAPGSATGCRSPTRASTGRPRSAPSPRPRPRCPERRRPSSVRAPGVELLSHALVLAGQLLGVHVGEADDPHVRVGAADLRPPEADVLDGGHDPAEEQRAELAHHLGGLDVADAFLEDRKSTRLNSSHGYISYAVFCLKKKKQLKNGG